MDLHLMLGPSWRASVSLTLYNRVQRLWCRWSCYHRYCSLRFEQADADGMNSNDLFLYLRPNTGRPRCFITTLYCCFRDRTSLWQTPNMEGLSQLQLVPVMIRAFEELKTIPSLPGSTATTQQRLEPIPTWKRDRRSNRTVTMGGEPRFSTTRNGHILMPSHVYWTRMWDWWMAGNSYTSKWKTD